jgi:hypothetical protein
MTTPMAIEAMTAVQPAADIYRQPFAAAQQAPAAHVAQFSAAMERALSTTTATPGAADRYQRIDAATQPASPGDGAANRLGSTAGAISDSFRGAIDETFAKVQNMDFTDPSSMVTMMEVQLGVFSAATQVQFASKVADFSIHGLTTLFRNQG